MASTPITNIITNGYIISTVCLYNVLQIPAFLHMQIGSNVQKIKS